MSFESPLARAIRLAGQYLGQGIQQYGAQRQAEEQQAKEIARQEAQRQAEAERRRQEQEGTRFANRAGQDLQTARSDLAQMRSLGAPPERVEAQQTLVNRLESAANAPLFEVPQAYRSALSGEVQPALRDAPTPRERAIGREPQTLRPGVTGGEQLGRGAGTTASLQRRAAMEDARAEGIMRDLGNFSPGDPNSVWKAYAALQRAETLPSGLREGATAEAEAITQAFEASPEAQQLYDNAIRRGELDVEEAEGRIEAQDVALERAQRELDYFKRTEPLQYERLQGQVGRESADRVVTALNTGVTEGLSDRERQSLVGVLPDVESVDNLDSWSQEKVAQTERLTNLEIEAREKQNAALDQDLKIGEQTYNMRETAISRDEWRFEREQFLARGEDRRAAVQDEEQIGVGISSAVANNDTELLSFYMSAYDNPESDLGAQMRTVLGEDYGDELARMYSEASERQELEFQMMQDDAAMRSMNTEMARLKLGQAEQLTPLETEALRVEYQRDARAATLDLRMMEFDNATNVIARGGEIAEAVPPEFWDDLPSNLATQFEQVGVDPAIFRNVSEHAEWLRGSARRQQGFQMLEFLVQSPPEKEADREVMLDGVFRAAEMMGFEDQAAQTAFAASAMSIWAEADRNMQLRMAQLAAQSAQTVETGMDPVDVSRVLNGWSSLATSRRQEASEVMPQKILNSGCATPLDLGVVEGIYINPESWKGADDGEEFSHCPALRQEYDNVLQSVTHANAQQRYWAAQLGEGEVSTPETGGPPPTTPPAPGPTSTPGEQPLFPSGQAVREAEGGGLIVGSKTLPPMLADRARGWFSLTESGQNMLLNELEEAVGPSGTQQVLNWLDQQ